jgi:hypothetical protein
MVSSSGTLDQTVPADQLSGMYRSLPRLLPFDIPPTADSHLSHFLFRYGDYRLDSKLIACQAYHQALDLMDRLSLSKDAHLYMQRKGRVDGLKVWESVSLSLG